MSNLFISKGLNSQILSLHLHDFPHGAEIYVFKYLTFFCEMAEYLQADKKQEIFAKYGKSNTDTGSPESQVALFSYRIDHLTEHVKKNKKDIVTRRSLLRLVGKRRQLLDYLQKVDIERYRKIIKELGLRR